MKKALSLILVLVLCLSLCACGSNNSNENEKSSNEDKNSEYVGIWKPVVSGKYAYLYIYKDGTGDYYKEEYHAGNYSHYNRFTWEVSDGYLAKQDGCEAWLNGTEKFLLKDNCLLDSQGKVVYQRYSSDPSVDIKF